MSAPIDQAPFQITDEKSTAPKIRAGVSRGSRMLYIDNLRILLISMVIVVHLGVTYGAIGAWYYHDPVTNLPTGIILTTLTGICMASGMGFFFLIAGYYTPGSYDRKGSKTFLVDRLIKLGIPLLIYDLLIDPLVVYIASGLPESYWRFYGNYLLHETGIANGPVWFIALLLLFTLTYAVWRWLTGNRKQATARSKKLPSYRAIFGFILALGLVTFIVRIWFPAGSIFQFLNAPIGYLPQYVSCFILGILAYHRDWFNEITPKMGKLWSLVALIVTLIFACLVTIPMVQETKSSQQTGLPVAGGFQWLSLCYALWESFILVGVCIGLLVLFRQRWNHQGKLAKNLAANVYTVYLIHPLVLVGFAYAFHVVALYPLLKFVISVIIVLPLCFFLSNLIRKLSFSQKVL